MEVRLEQGARYGWSSDKGSTYEAEMPGIYYIHSCAEWFLQCDV
ncbi:MAG: hypothetical protein RMJ59_01815 [Candidatus Nitrosocaldus sp.]|nr:hypothetical protein [Candidatus Nitrosocaldus sp.]MCS7140670.1 hypothetical protein [Candidatus Nitrosocaldus sp.]MDW7999515.1 hypothetical protein [Candidatus Nitrosocaldus sp.]MDW8275103.1 hypothetical protein [Candidatus Nitrosocaldus sp.]